jgi:hypothetical protein
MAGGKLEHDGDGPAARRKARSGRCKFLQRQAHDGADALAAAADGSHCKAMQIPRTADALAMQLRYDRPRQLNEAGKT